MKIKNCFYLVSLLLSAGAYGQEAPEPIVDGSVKAEILEEPKVVVSNSAYTQDVLCQKGNRKNGYRIAYKNQEGEPPCKVYEVKDGGKTKKIGESQRTLGVCEGVMERVIRKLEDAGMDCDSATISD